MPLISLLIFICEIDGNKRLFETYHGVFVNVQYSLTCDLLRTFLAKNLQKKIEFIIECGSQIQPKEIRTEFQITPQVC